MIIYNCKLILSDKIIEGSLEIQGSIITNIYLENHDYSNDKTAINGNGAFISPGFIDIHIHGAGGSDIMDATYDSLNNISSTILKHGTTSFLATTMTCSSKKINQSLYAIDSAMKKGISGANILGCHLEGPFISLDKTGAQNPDFVISPTIKNFNEIVKKYIYIIKTITLAPEICSLDFIKYIKEKSILMSIGHTNCNYDEAMFAISNGFSHSTHFFNAMSSFNHREPGAVGAILNSHITTELICDGIHISYPAIEVAIKCKKPYNVALVSDAMRACCMPSGNYTLGDQLVFVNNNSARLNSGTLAGSILTLDKAIYNLYTNLNFELYEIIQMVTSTPARIIGVDNFKGSLKPGYDADLVLFFIDDSKIFIDKVFLSGVLQ